MESKLFIPVDKQVKSQFIAHKTYLFIYFAFKMVLKNCITHSEGHKVFYQ